MPNKTRRRARRQNRATVQQLSQKLRQTQIQPRKRRPTPFADAGAITGQRLGSMFNLPMLKGVGKWLGSGIGTILGSGDYNVVGPSPAYNVLANGNQIPKFNSTKQTNIICHREYLGDIFGTAGFNNQLYPLNPGVSTTFPWLSTIAQNYQQYKFHGLIFEFRPLITDFVTNGAPGVVIMATNYNADSVAYTTKQQMENSEYAVSVKPTRDLMHGVECATNQTVLSELYVRNGAPPAGQDLRLYDLGNFQFATQANPVQDLGELWVSYCVEFFKPILPSDVGGNILSTYVFRTGITNLLPLGTVSTILAGDLALTITSDTITWTAQPGNAYLVLFHWTGNTAVWTAPSSTITGLTAGANFPSAIAPQNGVSTQEAVFHFIAKCSLLNPGIVSIKLGTAGVIPIGTGLAFTITEYSVSAAV